MTQLRESLRPQSQPGPHIRQVGCAGVQETATAPQSETESTQTSRWQVVTLNDLTAVTGLLDLLETLGIDERELVVLGERHFVVRWRANH